jgi:hypothetical protein
LSVAPLFGNEATGYICEACLAKEQEDLTRLGRELSEVATIEVAEAWLCPICRQTKESGRLVKMDARMAVICDECYGPWLQSNRDKLGPEYQHGMKLK